MRQVRHAVQFHLQRYRNLLLHLFRRMSRPLGDHLRVRVGHVGIRFDRQVMERNDAPHEQHQRSAQNHQAVAQRKIDHHADHSFFSATSLENSSAFVTTSSPGFTPSRISCMPSGASPSACTPTRRNLLFPSLRNTQSLSCKRMMAGAGTTIRTVFLRDSNFATANIPGRSAPSLFASTILTFAERVAGSSTRETSATVPRNTRSPNALSWMFAESPRCTSPRSFSNTSHTTHTWLRSAIVKRFGVLSRLFTPSNPATFCSTIVPATGARKSIRSLGCAGSAPNTRTRCAVVVTSTLVLSSASCAVSRSFDAIAPLSKSN